MFSLRRMPMLPVTELRRELDRLFDGFLDTDLLGSPRAYPAMNLWEDGERLFAEAEVPGLDMHDLEILIHGNELCVKGHRQPVDSDNATYHRRERGTGEFARYLALPVEVNADKVEAALKDGVLTIVMPKAENARARKITVKTA